MAIFVKVTGTKQGVFKGAVSVKGFESQIEVNTCDFWAWDAI